jgi:hypothetical protein
MKQLAADVALIYEAYNPYRISSLQTQITTTVSQNTGRTIWNYKRLLQLLYFDQYGIFVASKPLFIIV